MTELKKFCEKIYNETYDKEAKKNETEVAAQKEAIKQATLQSMKQFPNRETSEIWKTVYEIHVHRKSGIDNGEVIAKIISADQSWKKSSGHTFEEMIKFLGTAALKGSNIEIVLQRDLHSLINMGELSNEPRDISWLKEQIKGSVFDLYAVAEKNEKKYCYGCIQSKTSIRDRVTRDREPSMQAMQSFFWSTIIVLDGDFLKLPKFISMVNGGTHEFPTNGWLSMYVFSKNHSNGRIFSTDLDFSNFKEHAIVAADFWFKTRQWMDNEWKPNFS